MRLLFDIETGPLPMEQLERVCPEFKAPANYRDEEKIRANIAEQAVKWLDEAALRAETCQVLAIGFVFEQGMALADNSGGTEAGMLAGAWSTISQNLHVGNEIVGFNIFGFDLPILIRRSHILGVHVPPIIRTRWKGRTYWHENMRDLMEEWTCGNREQRISLDTMAKALGVGAKNGSGKDFAALWASDRTKAIEYLRNDLELLRLCAERML